MSLPRTQKTRIYLEKYRQAIYFDLKVEHSNLGMNRLLKPRVVDDCDDLNGFWDEKLICKIYMMYTYI